MRKIGQAAAIIIAFILFAKIVNATRAEIFYTKGERLFRDSQYQEALINLEKSIALNSNEPTYLAATALAWAKIVKTESQYDIKRCYQLTQLALKKGPRDSLVLKRIIHAFFSLAEKDANALNYLKETASLLKEVSPSEPRSYFYMAIASALTGDLEKANKEIEGALEKRPDFYEAILLRDSIRKDIEVNTKKP